MQTPHIKRNNTQSAYISKPLFSYKKFWAHRFGIAPVLPMSLDEMAELGWDSCDIIIVTGDAYVDHPSFGAAVIGRVLEAQGFRVGIISQPDLSDPNCMLALGKPNLYFAVTSGNMDSMVNHYTSDKKKRHNDAYTPNDDFGKRPDRAVIKYTQAVKTVYKDLPVIIGGIEASLRRLAHFDYWSDKVRRSVLLDSKADLLIYGNAERAIVEISHRIANKQSIIDCFDIRGIAFCPTKIPDEFAIIDASSIERAGVISKLPVNSTSHYSDFASFAEANNSNPYLENESFNENCSKNNEQSSEQNAEQKDSSEHNLVFGQVKPNNLNRSKTVINLPSFEAVSSHLELYAHTNRIFHLETNPGNARHLMQQHEGRKLWITPPPIPLTTAEIDGVFGLPYNRLPHPKYAGAKITAYEMIKNSINIMRGCFGGCTFCSITEHEGRIIQSRSEQSILDEIDRLKATKGFTGVISDLGGPTANMYRLGCKDAEVERHCRKLSCVYPGVCSNLDTNHQPLIDLYRKSRKVSGIKRVFVASGLRYDLAVLSPEYVKELVTHHVGGYLKIAPEHTEQGPLQNMMKPGISTYDKFKELFEKTSKEAGKEQYLIPYFIAAHPGTTDLDMLNLAIWLKKHDFRADQVQAFLPSPMSIATAMWHSGFSPLKGLKGRHKVASVKSAQTRKLHKAFLRYHDPENWQLLRESLIDMGREDLIGNSKNHLIPTYQAKKEPAQSSQGSKGAKNKSIIRTKTGTDFKKDYKNSYNGNNKKPVTATTTSSKKTTKNSANSYSNSSTKSSVKNSVKSSAKSSVKNKR